MFCPHESYCVSREILRSTQAKTSCYVDDDACVGFFTAGKDSVRSFDRFEDARALPVIS